MGKKSSAKAAYQKRHSKKKRKAAQQAKLHRQQQAANARDSAQYRAWAERQNRQIAQGDAWRHICHDKVA